MSIRGADRGSFAFLPARVAEPGRVFADRGGVESSAGRVKSAGFMTAKGVLVGRLRTVAQMRL